MRYPILLSLFVAFSLTACDNREARPEITQTDEVKVEVKRDSQ